MCFPAFVTAAAPFMVERINSASGSVGHADSLTLMDIQDTDHVPEQESPPLQIGSVFYVTNGTATTSTYSTGLLSGTT